MLSALMLIAHIFYFKVNQLTEGKSVFNGISGVVGMNMNLDYLIVINHNNAIAYTFKISPQCLRLLFALRITVYYKLGALGKGYFGFKAACGADICLLRLGRDFSGIL